MNSEMFMAIADRFVDGSYSIVSYLEDAINFDDVTITKLVVSRNLLFYKGKSRINPAFLNEVNDTCYYRGIRLVIDDTWSEIKAYSAYGELTYAVYVPSKVEVDTQLRILGLYKKINEDVLFVVHSILRFKDKFYVSGKVLGDDDRGKKIYMSLGNFKSEYEV